jgi:CoA:oxalate CoA-transferase
MSDLEAMPGESAGPLDGVRVLAIENYLAGNYGSMLLREFGAEVIKVEPPGGDALRRLGPMAHVGGEHYSQGELRLMRGKKSICLDLRDLRAREILRDLIAVSDVLWTNLKPSSLASYGIDAAWVAGINPRAIFTTLSGFGHDDVLPKGPCSDWPAFDIVAQAMGGLLWRVATTDGRPGYNGLPVGDQVTSLFAVLGTVLRLYARGVGSPQRRVDVAMYDAMVALNEKALSYYIHTGVVPDAGESSTSSPYGVFEASDGFVAIAAGTDAVWHRVCAAIDRVDLKAEERFSNNVKRMDNRSEVNAIVGGWLKAHTVEEITTAMTSHGVPFSPVNDTAEVVSDSQAACREMIVREAIPYSKDTLVSIGNPVKPFPHSRVRLKLPPRLGADTDQILEGTLGYPEATVQALRAARVVA